MVRPTGASLAPALLRPGHVLHAALLHGTSIAVLTYIGFDGISTMSEEVENPRRNILLATVLTCLAIGMLSAVEVYVAQLAWPTRCTPSCRRFVDTAYVHVALRVGGRFLFPLLNATLLIANMGSGIAAQFGAARLLYGMGRANALPSRIFGAASRPHRDSRTTTCCCSASSRCWGASCSPSTAVLSCSNFGAFIAFMGVNLAALLHYGFRSKEKVFLPVLMPLLGFLVCGFIWLNLARTAQLLGTAWIAVGLLVYLLMRRAKGTTSGAPSPE